MSKLGELIESLRTCYVVIVENDFQYITNPNEIVGHFVELPENKKSRILAKLKESETDGLAKQLEELDSAFKAIDDHDEKAKPNLLPNNLSEYLSHIDQNEILSEDLISNLEQAFQNDEDNYFKEIFLREGILTTTSSYDKILSELKKVPGLRLIYFKSTIPVSQMEYFKSRLADGMSETGSMFWLAIVDKMLGEGTVDDEGIDLMNRFIELKHSLVGFILSSDANDTEPEKYDDYFLREISKQDDTLLETITQRLAEAAYAEVFNKLNNAVRSSSQRAEEAVLKNQKNIKHIVDRSHNEGIPASAAVKNWFKGAMEMHLLNQEREMHKFLGGLTKFFDNDYLPDHPNLNDITDELREISTFEIFDYTINNRHEFPAAGDIFFDGEDYFVLTGQGCELLLRIDNERQAHVAELLEAEFEPGKSIEKKLEIKQTNNEYVIYIQNFKNHEGQTGVLKVYINSSVVAQFHALDTSAFNDNGKCEIHIEEELAPEIISVLPKAKEDYFKKIQTDINAMIQLREQVESIPDGLFSNISNGLHNFEYNENSQVADFKLKRICRIKGDFNKFITNSFNNYRGRVDLNQIHQTQKRRNRKKISLSIVGHDSFEDMLCVVYEEERDFYILKEDLKHTISDDSSNLLEYLPSRLELNADGENYLLQKNNGDFELILYYLIDTEDGLKTHNRDAVNGYQINRKPPPESWHEYGFSPDNLDQTWGNNGEETLDIQDTFGESDGIYVNNGNTRIFLEGRVIKVEEV